MRVTGGSLANRELKIPGAIRPTQDRVRQALFSSIAARVPGSRFLDLFAGSGAVGLEAWSRGAGFVCWVEQAPRTASTLKANAQALCGRERGGSLRIVTDDVARFLRRGPVGDPFDVIFADPPYGDRPGQPGGWLGRLLALLAESAWLKREGLFVMEQSAREGLVDVAGWALADAKRYGETALLVYRFGVTHAADGVSLDPDPAQGNPE